MDTQKQVVHFEAKKGFSTAQSNEHQRRWTEKGWERANANGRIDRTRTDLNFEIVKGGKVQAVDKRKTIPEKFRENIELRGIKDLNASCPDDPKYRTVVDFIISGTHDTLHDLAFGTQKVSFEKGADNSGVERKPEIERWAREMYDVLAGKYGEENILSFVVHLDERTPHIHADLIPVTAGNKISFNQVFVGGDKYEFSRRSMALHDQFAAVNRKWGLLRGDSVHETHRQHQSTEVYRRNLSGQCSTLERKVNQKSAILKKLDVQISQAEKREKSLRTMVSNLEASRKMMEREMDSIRRSLVGTEMDPVQRNPLLQKEESMQKKLDEILSKLADKRGKLEDAEKKLKSLQRQVAQTQERHEDLQRQIDAASTKLSESAMNQVSSEALWSVLYDFQVLKSAMPAEQAAAIEDSLLQDMSRRGMKIITCAALLSMGLVDQATTFAENCGGGGGGNMGEWGRDRNEDDRQWIRRCLVRSRQMLSPNGRKVKR